MTAEKNLWMHF